MVSTTPPPPKSGGSGGFIAAAIIMLLLMGGLIYWKLRGDDAPKQATPTPPPPTVTAPPLLDDPPPPPPKIEEPENVTKPVSGKNVVRRGGCAATCGDPSAAVTSALRGKAGQVRACYERALRQNNLLAGKMVIGVKIASNGQVCSANVVSNGLGDPGVATCVVQMFKAGAFPASQNGCVEANVPLNFIPKP